LEHSVEADDWLKGRVERVEAALWQVPDLIPISMSDPSGERGDPGRPASQAGPKCNVAADDGPNRLAVEPGFELTTIVTY
jgi:hypothetical protein